MADEEKSTAEESTDEKSTAQGQSFYNESLTGSGTILPDGTYGEPLPDPTVVRGLGRRKTSGGRDVPDPASSVTPASVDPRNDPAPKGDGRKPTAPVKATATKAAGDGGTEK